MFKPGDLVMVVKPQFCCGTGKSIGKVFRVHSIMRVPNAWCNCGAIKDTIIAYKDAVQGGFDVQRLRLIPPLSDLETTEREVEHAA